MDYAQKAIVTTVRCEQAHAFTAWQRFLPTGPLAFLPLLTHDGDAHHCSIVWTLDNAASGPVLDMDDAAFCAALGAAFEHRLGQVEGADRRFAFPLRARHARDYATEGLALIGDAAHTVHPLAGQGVNLGLLDAAVLAEEILHAMQRGLAVDEYSALRRFSRRRRGHNMLVQQAMTGFQKLFGADDLGVRLLRNIGMRGFDQLVPVKHFVMRETMGLSGELRHWRSKSLPACCNAGLGIARAGSGMLREPVSKLPGLQEVAGLAQVRAGAAVPKFRQVDMEVSVDHVGGQKQRITKILPCREIFHQGKVCRPQVRIAPDDFQGVPEEALVIPVFLASPRSGNSASGIIIKLGSQSPITLW